MQGTAALLALVAALVVAAVPAAHAGSSVATANRAIFADKRGEEPGSADITTVTVSNDDDGRITFAVAIPDRPTLTQDLRIRIWLKDASGRDSFLLVDPFEPAGFSAQLYRCKPRETVLVCAPSPRADLRFSYSGGAARFSFDADDLGIRPTSTGPAKLSFWVATLAGIRFDPTAGYDLTSAHYDRAPSSDGASWTYAIRLRPPALVVRSVSTSPLVAEAGTLYTVRLAVARANTGALLARGVVSCSARVAGRALAGTGRFAHGRAACTFRIPADARGKRLRGSISVASGGQRVTRAFAWWIA